MTTARTRISGPPHLTPGRGCYKEINRQEAVRAELEILEEVESEADVEKLKAEKIFRSISALNRTRKSLASDTRLDRSGHLLDQALAKH